MSKAKADAFQCQNCEARFPKWMGRCLECQSLNSVFEISTSPGVLVSSRATRIREVALDRASESRQSTGLSYLDKLLQGGVPPGTVILLAGEPGIGKSTLLFQMMARQTQTVLYVSAEESLSQIARRFKNFTTSHTDELFVISENRIEAILDQMDRLKPKMLVIDSIQMMMSESAERMKGGAASLREVTEALVNRAKERECTLWIVGHVNKEGDIAGPKTLEHMVDTVLVFSLAEDSRLRILQTQKHRFGPSGEVVLLEMDERGLQEKQESDSYWTQSRQKELPGCALVPVLLGSRVVIVEVQALVVDTFFPSPRRSTSGFDMNRLYMILAVLEKKLRLPFSRSDVYLNVVGGLKISDPGADLAVAAALVSAMTEKEISSKKVFFGEIGLTGELRSASASADRVRAVLQRKSAVFVGPTLDSIPRPAATPLPIIELERVEDALKEYL